MNVNQERVWLLLKEVTELCDNAGIPWFLSGRTAMRAYDKGIFSNGFLDVEITIHAKYAMHFLQVFEEQKNQNRVVESLWNNPRFPGFYMKYVDLSTTLFRMNEGLATKYRGIFVGIHFLRNGDSKDSSTRKAQKLEAFVEDSSKQYVNYTGETSWAGRVVYRIYRKIGGVRLSKRWFRMLASIYSEPGESVFLESVKINRGLVAFRKDRFVEVNPIIFNGYLLNIPSNPEEYFDAISDKEWRQCETEKILEGRDGTMIIEGANNIVSVSIPYWQLDSLLKKSGLNKRLFRLRQKEIFRKDTLQNLSSDMQKYWVYASRSGDIFYLYDNYSRQREYIYHLYDEGKTNELKDIFSLYDKTVRKYEKISMGIYYDGRLLEIYIYMLNVLGQHDFASRICQLVKQDDILKIQLDNIDKIIERQEAQADEESNYIWNI